MKNYINLFALPSEGKYYKDADYLLEIPLYTLSDVLDYNNYPVYNYIHKVLRDIDTLKIESSDDLLFYDLTAVSFLKKCMSIKESINFDFNFTCSECNREFIRTITLNDINFKTGLNLPDQINIGTETFTIKCPTLKDIKQLSRIFLGYRKLPAYEIFLICSYLNFESNPNRIKYVVENATKEDIVSLLNIIDNLDPLLPNKIPCKYCEKESVVKLSALTADLFSLFRINYRADSE